MLYGLRDMDFSSLHLFIVIRSLHIQIKSKLVIVASMITVIFISYNLVNILSYDFHTDDDFIAIIVTILYPILDFILNIHFFNNTGNFT